MRKKLLSFSIVYTFILLLSAIFTVHADEAPALISKTAVLMDADSGQILYEKNMHEIKAPASITKIPTLYLSALHASGDDELTVTSTAIDIIPEAADIALTVGEIVTMRDMQYASILKSANDACNVIAEAVSGSISEFATLMNEFAKESGALNTTFLNPHGLPEEEHLTTAYDMAMITKAALENKEFISLFSAVTYEMPANNNSAARNFVNIDLMMNPDSEYYYEGILGAKTGWTLQANNTKVTVAVKEGRTLIAVVMDALERENIYTDTAALLDYGFEDFHEYTVNTSSFDAFTVEVTDGENEWGTARVSIAKELSFLIPNETSASDITYSHNIPEILPLKDARENDYMLTVTLPEDMNSTEFLVPLHIVISPTLIDSSDGWFNINSFFVSEAGIIISAIVILLLLFLIRRRRIRRRRKRRTNSRTRYM